MCTRRVRASPDQLSRVGAALGVCGRPLTAAEKKQRIDEMCKHTGESVESATKLLELSKFEVPSAMKLWAGFQGAIVLESDEEDADGDENDEANSMQPAHNDVARTMNRSSYGRIVKMLKRIATLSQAATLTLPAIIIVGSESSGKSSTIERIAGFSLFPRDAKICTRMPIRLSLINSDQADGETTVTLKFAGRADLVVTEQGAARAVGKLMAELAPTGQGVIDQQLTVEVRKASVPTLDLIDLPGIVAASIEGEPADMMSRTRAITERYMRDANTIVVVVVPANITRVRDSQAIQLVQACRKEAVTLGVLAKADLAHDPRYKQRKQASPYWELSRRLAGEADDMVALPNGWVAVKNRDTLVAEEEAGGLATSAMAEREWFSQEAKISEKTRASQCGIDALLSKIDGLFTSHIKSTWVPKALGHLQAEAAAVDAKVEALGPSPSSLTLSAVLAQVGDSLQSDQARSLLDSAVYAGARAIVDEIMQATPVSTVSNSAPPCLAHIISKGKIELALQSGVRELLHVAIGATKQALQLAFEPNTSAMRLERFEVLRDALCENVGAVLTELDGAFHKAAAHALARHFEAAVGIPWVWSEQRMLLAKSLTEIALKEFVVPLILKPEMIMDKLNAAVASGGSSATVGSKRARSNAASAGAASTTLNAPSEYTAHVLLIESCAAERTMLIKRKHDLFIALSECQKL